MTANFMCTIEQWSQTFTKPAPPIGWHWFTLLAVQTCNQSSKLLTQTHQLHYPASRTWYSDTVSSYRRTSVLL